MNKQEEILIYLEEINNTYPEKFSDFFIENIISYLGIQNFENTDEKLKQLSQILGLKFHTLINCKSKEDVKNWLDDIAGFIVMKLNIEDIIDDYISH